MELISRVPMDWKPASPPFAASMYILPMPLWRSPCTQASRSLTMIESLLDGSLSR